MEIVIVMHNIRSCQNVGAILRTCEGFGVSWVIFSGITPRMHDDSLLPHLREKLDKQIHKTALGAEDMVSLENSSDILKTIDELKRQGFLMVGLENNIDSPKLINLRDFSAKMGVQEKIVLVLGEEVNGIPLELREKMDIFVEIPMTGRKESFNVSVATGIALYGLTEC